jgi:hypothetical protein
MQELREVHVSWSDPLGSEKKMDIPAKSSADRRRYQRRSDEELLADLERRISDLKARQAAQDRKNDPILREIPRLQRRLRTFAQLAMDNERPDIANSTTAFAAGLERTFRAELARNANRAAPPEQE